MISALAPVCFPTRTSARDEVVFERLSVMFGQSVSGGRTFIQGVVGWRIGQTPLSHPTGETLPPRALEGGRGPNVELEHDSANQ
jgi:hypothetical protein